MVGVSVGRGKIYLYELVGEDVYLYEPVGILTFLGNGHWDKQRSDKGRSAQ